MAGLMNLSNWFNVTKLDIPFTGNMITKNMSQKRSVNNVSTFTMLTHRDNMKPFIHYSPNHTFEILSLLNPSKPVQVYRNLHKKCWSVLQDGIVKLHTDCITLKKVKFKVSQTGRQRVLQEKRKNVHAVVEGFVCSRQEFNDNSADFECDNIYYNPYQHDSFVNRDCADCRVDTADFCDMMIDDPSPVIAYGAK